MQTTKRHLPYCRIRHECHVDIPKGVGLGVGDTQLQRMRPSLAQTAGCTKHLCTWYVWRLLRRRPFLTEFVRFCTKQDQPFAVCKGIATTTHQTEMW